MIDAVILDGGRATRATHLPPDMPKCLAPMPDGRPLLDHLHEYLGRQQIDRVVVALSEGRESVIQHMYRDGSPHRWRPKLCTDTNPRRSGTVDAVRHVLSARLPEGFDENFGRDGLIALNGDTLLRVDLQAALELHRSSRRFAHVVLATDIVTGAESSCGVRLLSPHARPQLDRFIGQDLDRDCLSALPAGVIKLPGAFLDIGTPEGWAKRKEWFV